MAMTSQALPAATAPPPAPSGPPQWAAWMPQWLQQIVLGKDGSMGLQDVARWNAILSNPALAALFYGGKEALGAAGDYAVPTGQNRPAPVDPYGQVGQDYTNASGQNPADQFALNMGDRVSDRAMQPELFGSQFGQPSFGGGGSGMNFEMLEFPGMPPIPVISGPQWEGPPGLPWTYGADPRSYPYSYIPPGESWANVGAGWGGGPTPMIADEPGFGPRSGEKILGPPSKRDYGTGGFGDWEGYDSVNFGFGTGGGGGSPDSWGDFSEVLPGLGAFY